MRNWGDGAWHNATTLLIAGFLLVVPFGLSDSQYLFLSAGALIALFVNPDLDQDGLTLAETFLGKALGLIGYRIGIFIHPALADVLNRIGKGFGLLFAGCWMAVWSFYAAFMPHRSFLSHFPIIGTTIRFIWIAGIVYLLRLSNSFTFSSMQLGLIYIGLCVADFGHYARDMKWFEMERYFGLNQ